MKRIILICCLIFFLACNKTECIKKRELTLEERIKLLNNPEDGYVMVAAHRGDWRNYPENSIAAIESAINMGVDIVEVDVQRTKDGIFILMHDNTLDRTTNTTGKVSDYTYKELKQYTLRHAHRGYSEEPIPTLKEALLTVKGKVLIDLDKAYKYIDEIVPLLRETGTLKQTLFPSSADVSDLSYPLLENPSEVIYNPVISEHVEGYKERIRAFESSKANPKIYELILTKKCEECYNLIKIVRANNDHVWVNSIYGYLSDNHWDDRALKKPDANWGFLIKKGVTILQTDRPDKLIKYLEGKALRTYN